MRFYVRLLVCVQVAQLTLQHILQQHAAVITQATQAVGTQYGRLVQQQQQQQSGKRLHNLQHAQQHQQLVSQPESPAFVPRGQVPTALLHQLWPAQQLLHSSQYHHHYQQQQQLVCAQQHLRHYHPATHAARGLTSRLLQQRTWQASSRLLALEAVLSRLLLHRNQHSCLRTTSYLPQLPQLLTSSTRPLRTFAGAAHAV